MCDVVSDVGVAAEISGLLTDVDLSGATVLTHPESTTVTGTIRLADVGVGLGDGFTGLMSVMDVKAEAVVQVADVMVGVDAELAGGLQ